MIRVFHVIARQYPIIDYLYKDAIPSEKSVRGYVTL